MHSTYQRFNNLTAFLSTCIFTLCAVVSLTTFVLQPSDSSLSENTAISVQHASIGIRQVGWHRQEVTSMNFNLTADLTPLFHWNTKQLFVYLTADYKSGDGTLNSVVVWDKIIRDERNANLKLVKKKPKYHLRDSTYTFHNAKPASYSLHYDVMPYVGALTSGKAGMSQSPVAFPRPSAPPGAKKKAGKSSH